MKYWIYILALVCLGISCGDDSENLQPSEQLEYHLTLPQGDHDYDQRIVEWYDSCGFYILYKFNPADVYFNVDNDWAELYTDTYVNKQEFPLGDFARVEGEEVVITPSPSMPMFTYRYTIGKTYDDDGLWTNVTVLETKVVIEEQRSKYYGSFLVEQADEKYVGDQLTLLENLFLNYYPKSLLRSTMPMKVVLGQKLRNSAKEINSYAIFNTLIFNHGCEAILSLTEKQKQELKLELNLWYLTQQLRNQLSFDEFYETADYPWIETGVFYPSADYYGLGVLSRPTYNLESQKENDLMDYLKMIMTNSYDKLTAEPASEAYNANDLTGILHPKKDVNGLIREKYDCLINLLKSVGIDLQGIGNE